MKQFALLALCLLPFAALQAQTTKEEMFANPLRMGGNNMAYNPEIKPQTPAPKGYTPFYISHYGRHGSRYHYTPFDYIMMYNQLKSADEANALTARGKELKKRVDALYADGRERAGDLTQKGFDQHQGIAERMVKSFPECFGANAYLDVKSSTSHRVIMSMDAFLQKVNSLRPGIKVKTESSRRIMYFINNEERDSVTAKLKNDAYNAANAKIREACTHPDRIINEIVSDPEYVKAKVKPEHFVSKLFELNCNMQDISDLDFDFSDFFTKDELFENWQLSNLYWYANFGNCSYADNRGAKCARHLLKNFLDEADKAIAGNGVTASLRFGHDTGLMPLASLMQLEGTVADDSDLTQLYKYVCDYKIVPMGGNLQMIFYRSPKSSDILVKVLLNEREVKLPLQSNIAPYYKWNEVEKYYRNVLDNIKL
ncbi:MAG: histidine-type phosphatase [Bacteroidales bacterium]|nr:histidine-type phosphatase [Bacteroidales bacterium]